MWLFNKIQVYHYVIYYLLKIELNVHENVSTAKHYILWSVKLCEEVAFLLFLNKFLFLLLIHFIRLGIQIKHLIHLKYKKNKHVTINLFQKVGY